MGASRTRIRAAFFYTEASCNAFGYKMKYVDSTPGLLNWQCHRYSGDPKWSIDLLWET